MNGLTPGIFIGFIVGVALSIWIGCGVWHTELVHRGFAEYNQTNGNWQWKQLEDKK